MTLAAAAFQLGHPVAVRPAADRLVADLPVADPPAVLSAAARIPVLILQQSSVPRLEIHAVCDPYLLPLGGHSNQILPGSALSRADCRLPTEDCGFLDLSIVD
jgi:hypothetical protein